MEKLSIILACLLLVADVKSGSFWGCATRGDCSSEESRTATNSRRKPPKSGNDKVGEPFSNKEKKAAKKFKGNKPHQDPTEQDMEHFEGDIKGLNHKIIKGYTKDAAEIQKYFEGLKKTDPKGHMDLSGLHLDPVLWRNAIKAKNGLWPKAQIPYWISTSFNSYERKVIAAAIADYHKFTCIRFIWRSRQTDYIYIGRNKGCSSYIGKQGRMQVLSLATGCLDKGTVLHELMHAAGFFHEQSRTDRDKYVTVHWNNVINGLKYNFEKYGSDKITHLGTRYDYNSIMHYSQNAFSKNGRPTIVPRTNARIGQSYKLSRNDIRKLNRLYQCNSRNQCKDKRSWCNYYWIDTYCYCGWVQRSCPKACGVC